MILDRFHSGFVIDFEFRPGPGPLPRPVCLVVHEVVSGKTCRYWEDDLARMAEAPYPTGPGTVTFAYYAVAEMLCFMALGWQMPSNVIDLFVEFKLLTNFGPRPTGAVEGEGEVGRYSLLGALAHFGIGTISSGDKEAMRSLILGNINYNAEERDAILTYCESDVRGTTMLLEAMPPRFPAHALLRGRYMQAVARMEAAGVPIDVPGLEKLRQHRDYLRTRLIAEVDAGFGVFLDGSFNHDRFARYLAAEGIPWPRTPTGMLSTTDEVFKERSMLYPQIAGLRELLQTLGQLRELRIEMGADGRNRTGLHPFRTATGRNAPSTARFIFGAPSWMRGYVQAAPGCAIAYLDYEQQEFAIAAALSQDPAMMASYNSGDPYLAFAKQAGAIPSDGTKETHLAERTLFKTVVLGVQYSMGEFGLADRLGIPLAQARDLLRLHHEAYPRFWRWSQAAVDYGFLYGQIHTVYGWQLRVHGNTNPRAVQNFPMQATGAEVLRLACCLATEAGIKVCAPVHDALLIEAPANDIYDAAATAQRLMVQASEQVLGGFPIRAELNRMAIHPTRLLDDKHRPMWDRVQRILHEATAEKIT